MTATAMGAALSAAGRNTAADRLYVAAVKALQERDGSITDAIRDLVKVCQGDPEIIQVLAADYLKRVSEDMRGLPGGGRASDDAHTMAAPSRQPNSDAAGRINIDAHANHAGASHPNGAGHSGDVRPVREPSPSQRRAASIVAQTIAVTVLDTYRIRDGRVIGDVRYGELDRLRSANAAEAALVRMIQRHGQAAHDTKLRDFIKAEVLQRMIQKAAEIADAS